MIESGVATEVAQPLKKRRKTSEPKTFGKTAKVGALWSALRESVSQFLSIPTTVVLARLLSPTDFGIAAAAGIFIQFAKRLGSLGLNTALVRIKDVRQEHLASVFVVNLVIGLMTWVALMLAAPWIGAFYGDARVTGALRAASTIFIVNFFGAVEHAVLHRQMKFKEIAFVEWTYPAVSMPLSIAMAVAGWGYWALIWSQVIASIATTLSKIYFGRWRPSLAVTRRGLAETIPFGLGVYAKRSLTYASENFDSLIVGGLFGITSLGFYDKAFNAADNIANRLAFGSSAMFRIFSIIQDDRPRLIRAYSKAVLAGTMSTLPIFAGLIVAAPEFIEVVFGEKWLPATVAFQFLCGVGALRLITSYASAAIQANGAIWGEVSRKVVHVVLVVGFVIALRPFGITGAAIGVFAATLILTLLMQGLVKRIIGMSAREIVEPMIPGIAAAAGTAACVELVTMLATRPSMPSLQTWVLLLLQVSTAGLFWTLFTLYVRFPALQDVVDEMLTDIIPTPVRSVIDKIRPRASKTTAVAEPNGETRLP